MEAKPKAPRAASNTFFEYGESEPNDDEILFVQLLIAVPPDSVAELDKWVDAVRSQRSAANENAEKENMITAELSLEKKDSPLYRRVSDAFKRSYSDDELDNIGAAMGCLGGHQNITSVQLRAYLKGSNAREPTIYGPRPTTKARKQPRWRSWQLLRVADGIRSRGPALRRALRGEEEQHLTMEQELEAALELNKELLEEVEDLLAERKKLQATARQQNKRLGEHAAAKTAARQKVRESEREKAAATRKAAVEAATQQTAAKAEKEWSAEVAELKEKAREQKERADKQTSQAKLSQKRLRRAQQAEAKVDELREQLDEMADVEDNSDNEEPPVSPLPCGCAAVGMGCRPRL